VHLCGGYAVARHHGSVRVLVVEDEDVLADAVAEWLRREAFAVDVVYDGDAATERIGVHAYDVVILDRDLPGVSGDDLCRSIVDGGLPTRVLMLTAAAAVRDRVAGLALGADDYLIKPFAMVEMAARVHALARRASAMTPPQLERAGLRLDPARHEATRDGAFLSLSLKEFGVLAELLRAQGAVVSSEHLLEKVWDEHIDPFTNTVRVTVMKLRKKLGEPQLIETVQGVGYRIA
jgi:DNA-binding response OmpR family regulator